MKNLLWVLSALLLLSACAKPFQADGVGTLSKSELLARSQAIPELQPEELFQQNYSQVDAICDVFVVDTTTVTASDKPVVSLHLPVYPQASGATQNVSSPSKKYTAVITFAAPTLSSWDVSMTDGTQEQTPLVKIAGQITGNLSDGQDGVNSQIGVAILTTWSQPIPTGVLQMVAAPEGKGPSETGTVSVQCRLIVQPLKTAGQ